MSAVSMASPRGHKYDRAGRQDSAVPTADINKCSVLAQIMFTVGVEWRTIPDTDAVLLAVGGADGLIRKARQWEREFLAQGRAVGDYADDLEAFTLDKIDTLMLDFK